MEDAEQLLYAGNSLYTYIFTPSPRGIRSQHYFVAVAGYYVLIRL